MIYTENKKIKPEFKDRDLENIGYTYSILEGGFISKNMATIVVTNRVPYDLQIMQYTKNADLHNENVKKLISLNLVQ